MHPFGTLGGLFVLENLSLMCRDARSSETMSPEAEDGCRPTRESALEGRLRLEVRLVNCV